MRLGRGNNQRDESAAALRVGLRPAPGASTSSSRKAVPPASTLQAGPLLTSNLAMRREGKRCGHTGKCPQPRPHTSHLATWNWAQNPHLASSGQYQPGTAPPHTGWHQEGRTPYTQGWGC